MGMLKFGELAPEIDAMSTMGKMNLNDYKGKWVVLFSHPRRFYTRLYNRNNSICKS